MAKIFTKHDPYHVHKLVGLLCLLHFFFRFSLLFRFGQAFPTSEPHWLTFATCGLHCILHATSFLFHVPAKRNFTQPMIWREFRRHNAILGLETRWAPCCVCFSERPCRQAAFCDHLGIETHDGDLTHGFMILQPETWAIKKADNERDALSVLGYEKQENAD